jgi:diacylglycerol kinase (ATP)
VNILKKLYNSTKWSLAGLGYVIHHELSFRIELFLVCLLLPAAFYVAQDLNQLLWLVFSLAFVLIAELINTAIEVAINRISYEQNDLSKHAKDIGSAVVFCTLVFVAFVWGLIIWNNF